ncbi:ABC transporter substrate-binding protein [Streptomyces sp. Pv4-95]|uniref:ABC transporter substrate-binding protein n=1 Tax=Streptomyces sp. Pv4-95 TaxID=3049543 RepID=UPI003891CDB5
MDIRPAERCVRVRRRRRGTAAALVLAALLPLVGGCGAAGAVERSPVRAQHKDPALHALLPEKIRKAGSLKVAEGDDYPPLVQLGLDNKTLVGMEPELMKAIGQVLGVDVEFSKSSFDSIIGGVRSHRYDLAIQAMLDKPERQEHVTFVDYFRTSSSILVGQDDRKSISSLADLCGRASAVEQGTSQVDDVVEQSKKCTRAGKPAVEVLVFPDSVGCFQALSTGRTDAFVGGSPTVTYQAEQSGGRLFEVGEPYRFLPYGILVNKDDKALAEAVQKALQKLIDNGAYRQILKYWKVESGALRRATVNGGTA